MIIGYLDPSGFAWKELEQQADALAFRACLFPQTLQNRRSWTPP